MNMRSDSIWTKNFICAMAANTLLTTAHTSVNTLASTYAAFLGAEAILVGTMTSVFFGVSVVMRPFSGPLTTRVNNRTIMIWVYILGIIVNAGYACFCSVGAFLFFRVLNGIQYSIIGSLTMKTASDSLPKSKVGSGIGVYCISNAIANALGPSAGVMMKELGTAVGGAEMTGFRFVFVFAVLLMLCALVPVFMLKNLGTPKKIPGSSCFKEMFSVHALAPAAALMLMMASYSLFSAYMVPYADSLGIPGISIFFLIHAMCLVATRPFFGRLADKFGLLTVALPGSLLFSVPLLIISRGTTLTVMLIGALAASVTHGAVYPTLQAMCMKAEPTARSGVSSNTVYLGLDLGLFVGPLLGSTVYPSYGYGTMYALAVIPCVMAAALLVFTWKRLHRRHAEIAEGESNGVVSA